MGSGGGGLLCFSPVMPVRVPWKTWFPIYQGVRCGMQMVAACTHSKWLKDLEGLHLMSSL